MKLILFFALSLVLVTSLTPASSFALINLNLDYPEFGNITFVGLLPMWTMTVLGTLRRK